MLYLAHRINTAAQLAKVPTEYGVELDLRDRGPRLIVQHDPFADGEDFETWIRGYRHAFAILNIKSERIEPRVLDIVRQAGIENYFFLDCSFPMIRALIAQGERRIAVRFSEFEPLAGPLALAGQIDWVWVDCFTKLPLDADSYRALKRHFKLCLVSPELQGRPVESIIDFSRELQPFPVDAICTKRPDLWEQALRTRTEA